LLTRWLESSEPPDHVSERIKTAITDRDVKVFEIYKQPVEYYTMIHPQHISIGAKMVPLMETLEIHYRVLGRNLRDEFRYRGNQKLRMINLK
jgi:hypothetical protein